MQKGINLATHELKQNIVGVINNSHLPACNIQSVLTEVLTQVNLQFNAEIEKEKLEFEKALEESRKLKDTPKKALDEAKKLEESPKEGELNGKEIHKGELAE